MPVPVATGPLLYEDTFTYADGTLTGKGDWANGIYNGQPSLRVVSNQAAGPAATGWADNYTATTTFNVGSGGLDFIARNITYAVGSNTWVYTHCLVTIESAGGVDGYAFRWRDGFTYGANRWDDKAFTAIITTSQNAVQGDDLCLRILSGGTIQLWRKPSGGSWAQIGSNATDTTYTSGRVGMETNVSGDRWDSIEVRSTEGISPGDLASAYSGTTIAPTIPAHASGDKLLVVAAKNDASSLSASAGWTAIETPQNDGNLSTGAWQKTAASGSETITVTSSTAASASQGLFAQAYVGVAPDFDNLIGAAWNGSPTTSTTPSSSGLTTNTAGAIVLGIALLDHDGGFASGLPPTDWSTFSNLTAAASNTLNYLDPDANGTANAWTKSSGTNAGLLLDDAVRSPTAPTTGTDRITSVTSGQQQTVAYPNTMTHVAGSTYTFWAHWTAGNRRGADAGISVNDGSSFSADQVICDVNATAGDHGWTSLDITSLITSTADLNGLQSRFTCTSRAGGGATAVAINACYVVQSAPNSARARFTAISRVVATPTLISAATIGTLSAATYWRVLTLSFEAESQVQAVFPVVPIMAPYIP